MLDLLSRTLLFSSNISIELESLDNAMCHSAGSGIIIAGVTPATYGYYDSLCSGIAICAARSKCVARVLTKTRLGDPETHLFSRVAIYDRGVEETMVFESVSLSIRTGDAESRSFIGLQACCRLHVQRAHQP